MDKETEFAYYGHRFYNPETGRWLNRDPMEERGGLNLYEYANNSPVNYVDMLGLYAELTSFAEAVKHWNGGSGDTRYVNLRRVNLKKLRASSFPKIQVLIKQCERERFSLFRRNSTKDFSRANGADSTFTVDANAQPDLFKVLGTFTLKAFGKFTCQCTSATSKIPWWKFEGEVAAYDDRFDWDWLKFPGDPIRNAETLGGRILVGPGKAFAIEIPGEQPFNDDSNK